MFIFHRQGDDLYGFECFGVRCLFVRVDPVDYVSGGKYIRREGLRRKEIFGCRELLSLCFWMILNVVKSGLSVY